MFRIYNGIAYLFANDKGCACQSGKEFENGVNIDKEKLPSTNRFAGTLADLHVFIFCNAISYSPNDFHCSAFIHIIIFDFSIGLGCGLNDIKFQNHGKPYRKP